MIAIDQRDSFIDNHVPLSFAYEINTISSTSMLSSHEFRVVLMTLICYIYNYSNCLSPILRNNIKRYSSFVERMFL